MNKTKVIIAGGGTGGHIFPAVAVAQALKKLEPSVELLFVGAKGKMEMEKVPQEGFDIVGLDIAGFNRTHIWKNILLPIKLIKSIFQARSVLRKFKPDAVLGVGGYASFPVLRAAQFAGIPTIIQEQNSFAGKSNKILGKRARAVCVAYSGMQRFFPEQKIVRTGNPVRKSISESKVDRAQAATFFGLHPERKTLLIVGGSLGAKSVNEAIGARLPEYAAQMQIIWQTGKPYFEQAKKVAEPFDNRVKVFAFIREMQQAYAAADIVVSRAGALAMAELCLVGKPCVFVPYPFAAEDHQTENAKALSTAGAGILVPDASAKADLYDAVFSIVNNPVSAKKMSEAIKRQAVADADEQIARIILAQAVTSKSRRSA